MAYDWQKAKVTASTPGARVNVDNAGSSFVRFLSDSFKLHDTIDYGYQGIGIQVIFNGVET